MTMQFASWQTIKERLILHRALTHRAMNSEGQWLHLNGTEFTTSMNDRWLGTKKQFENMNLLWGGKLIPVKADLRKFTFQDSN